MEATQSWEYAEEFKALATNANFRYLWLIGKDNGSFMHFSGKSLHFVGEHQYETAEEMDYVLLSQGKDWSDDIVNKNEVKVGHVDLNRLVELLVIGGESAFFETHWDVGLMPFLVAETTPEEFRPFVLLHEAHEISLQGVGEGCVMDVSEHIKDPVERKQHIDESMKEAAKYPHQQACIQELRQVILQGEEFFVRYANWLWSANYPDNPCNTFDQYLPGFMSQKTALSPTHRMIEFFYYLEAGGLRPSIDDPYILFSIDRQIEMMFSGWPLKYATEVKADLISRHQKWYNQHILARKNVI